MQEKIHENIKSVGKLNKRRVLMEDGKRYLIFYTFGEENVSTKKVSDEKNAEVLPEAAALNSKVEEDKLNV